MRGSMRKSRSFQQEMFRFLWNLMWVPARFHAQEHWLSGASGQVLVEPAVGFGSWFLWNLKWVPARHHAQEPQFSVGNVKVPVEPHVGSCVVACAAALVFKRTWVGSCDWLTPQRVPALHGCVHRSAGLQLKSCRFLWNLQWVPVGLQGQEHWFSGPRGTSNGFLCGLPRASFRHQ